jgi:hypothetical protein
MQPAISPSVISELLSVVRDHFGPRLKAIYLCVEPIFEADDSSDVELLAVLAEPVDPVAEIWEIGPALGDFSVEHSLTAAIYPFSQQGFDDADWFFARAKQTAKRVA